MTAAQFSHINSSTGAFCDPQILAWSSQSSLNSSQACSDCWLGGQAAQLSNPLGYDASLASQFASLTSSCNATGKYPTTSPTLYAINGTATITPAPTTSTPATSCTDSYTVQDGDECNSVALGLGVSTYDLLYTNDLDIYCQNFASAVNSTLCVPPGCDTHVWQGSDSCESVVSTLDGVTVPEFLSWNPNFNSLCQNSVNFLNYVVCVRYEQMNSIFERQDQSDSHCLVLLVAISPPRLRTLPTPPGTPAARRRHCLYPRMP